MKHCWPLFFLLFACGQPASVDKPERKDSLVSALPTEDDSILPITGPPAEPGKLQQHLEKAGLVDVLTIDSSFVVDLRYSTTNNFIGKDVYSDFDKVYLQPDVAEKLVIAQNLLRSKFPRYSLIIFDGVRPRSIQQMLWDQLDTIPVKERGKYVSNPKYGSLHNFGAAVDLSIVDQYGDELDMGTEFDYFGELAYPTLEEELLAQGKLTEDQIKNRELLRKVMYDADFFNIQTEWWHFNSCYRKQAVKQYKIVE